MKTFEDSYRHKGMRRGLVKLLEQKGIKSREVLNAIGKVPRHFFFESAFIEHAYQDKAFSIGEGQTISQPYTVARQTELLGVRPGDKVLEIGTGSGYQACILMEMGVKLYTIEYNKVLQARAQADLKRMGYEPHMFLGDGSKGLPQHAPFSKIIVTCGAPDVPEPLIAQLAIDGVMVIPVGPEERQKMLRLTKTNAMQVLTEEFGDYNFVPLVGEFGRVNRQV